MDGYSYTFYEEDLDHLKRFLSFLPFALIIGSFLIWKLFSDVPAVTLIALLWVAGTIVLLFHSGKTKIIDDTILLQGYQSTTIALHDVKRAYLGERLSYSQTRSIDPHTTTSNALSVTLPVSISSYLCGTRGVIIERVDQKDPWHAFIPSKHPELLLKAIEDAKRAHGLTM